jgi:photoactive yellow protein
MNDAKEVSDTLTDTPSFDSPDLPRWLESATNDDLDNLPFGLVALNLDASVAWYNKAEGRLSGLTPDRMLGRQFFTSVAPCTNNFMVAHRFETEPDLDAIIDYVFTFRLAPLKVRLRLLKRQDSSRWYLAVTPRE